MADTRQIVERVIVPALGDVGYSPDYLQLGYPIPDLAGIRNYVTANTQTALQPPSGQPDRLDILAFTRTDRQDWSTSAIAVDVGASANGTEASRKRAQALFEATAAPTTLVGVERQRVDVWFNCHNGMIPVPGVALNLKALGQAFRDHQTAVRRDRLAELRSGQRHLFDNHLFALRGDLVGYLQRGIRAAIAQSGGWWKSDNKKYLTKKYSNLRVAFSKIALALLAARILEDKGALGANREQSTDARALLSDAHKKWDSFFDDVAENQLPALDDGFPDDADRMLESLLSHLTGPVHFGLVTHEMLGDLYEQAELPARRLAVAKQTRALFPDKFRLRGVHYTPFPITRRIVERIPFEDLQPAERVTCDLTCGSGSFLVAATDRLAELYDPRELEAGLDSITYLQRTVCGNDIDDVALLLVKLTYLLAYWSRSLGREGIPYPKVVNGNALDLDPITAFKIQPSIFVGNPPFDSGPSAGTFLTHAVSLLWKRERGTRGFIGMVMPQSFLKGLQHHQAARKFLFNHARLLEVWELPEETIGLTAKIGTSVILAEVRAGEPGRPRIVRINQTYAGQKAAVGLVRDAGIPTWSYVVDRIAPVMDNDTCAITPAPFSEPKVNDQADSLTIGSLAHVVWGFLNSKDKNYPNPVFRSSPSKGYVPYIHRQSALRPYSLIEADWQASHSNAGGYWKLGSGPRPRKKNWPYYKGPKIIMTARGNINQYSQIVAAVDQNDYYPGKDFLVVALRDGWQQVLSPVQQSTIHTSLTTLRWVSACLNSPVGHAWAATHNTGRGVQAEDWEWFPLPAVYDPEIIAHVEELERLSRPADLADTPIWNPPEATTARHPRGTPSLPGMEEEQTVTDGSAYWEIVRDINRRVFESYRLSDANQSQIITFLRSMTEPWADHPRDVAELPPHTELRVMQGTVRNIDISAQTITLKLSWVPFRPGPVTIPIPKFMPGWALEEGREFTCRAPCKTTLDDLLKNEWLLRDFRPQPYGYLSVSEMEEMLGFKANRTDKT